MAKPINTWNAEGMGYEWREKCPLNGAERYLWKIFKKFPEYDWRDPASRSSRSDLHIYYEEGWSYLRSLQDHLFASSSVMGKEENPPFCNFLCEWPGCSEPSRALVNQQRTDRKDKYGDVLWEWLPDAPRFYCYPHYHEHNSGEKYVPPTDEEFKLFRAQWKAQEYLSSYDVGRVKGTTENVRFVMMDKNYLQRMVKLIEFFLDNPDGTPPMEMMTEELAQ